MLSADIAEVQPLYGLVFLRASSMSRQMLYEPSDLRTTFECGNGVQRSTDGGFDGYSSVKFMIRWIGQSAPSRPGFHKLTCHSKRLFSSGDASSTPMISRAAMTSWWSCMSRCAARDGIDVELGVAWGRLFVTTCFGSLLCRVVLGNGALGNKTSGRELAFRSDQSHVLDLKKKCLLPTTACVL